jgi:hypothetical protein
VRLPISNLLPRTATVVGLRQPGRPITFVEQGLVATFTDSGLKLMSPRYIARDPRGVPPAHLSRLASSIAEVVDQGFTLRAEPGELVHRATRDLWGFEQDDEGRVVLCRLFDPAGHPLKV